MPYDEALLRFGTDRPDLRFGLEIVDISDHLRGSDFKVFASVLDGGGVVRAINAGRQEMSRKDLEGLNEVVQRHGGKAVAWAFVEDTGGWRSPIAKFFGPDAIAGANSALGATEGDLILFVADAERTAAEALGGLRVELGARFGLIGEGRHEILWTVDFPAFEPTADGGWTAVHHPFTAPLGDLAGDPGALKARAYDLILDGSELGGGSIRINETDVQQRVLEIIGMDEEEAHARFGFLLEALRHGAPPLGGIAFGIDRIVAIMGGYDSIRDVIAFPKTASGVDPLTGAPAPVDERQLRELRLKLRLAPLRLDAQCLADELLELAGHGEAADGAGAAGAVDDEHRGRGHDRDAAGDRLVLREVADARDVDGDLAAAAVEALDGLVDGLVVGQAAIPEEEDGDLAVEDVVQDDAGGLRRLRRRSSTSTAPAPLAGGLIGGLGRGGGAGAGRSCRSSRRRRRRRPRLRGGLAAKRRRPAGPARRPCRERSGARRRAAGVAAAGSGAGGLGRRATIHRARNARVTPRAMRIGSETWLTTCMVGRRPGS